MAKIVANRRQFGPARQRVCGVRMSHPMRAGFAQFSAVTGDSFSMTVATFRKNRFINSQTLVGEIAAFGRSLIVNRTRGGVGQGHEVRPPPWLNGGHIDHARSLVDGGKTVKEVAGLLGVHRATLYRALRATVETERVDDGRHIAEVADMPGVIAYGDTEADAIARVQDLARRVLAERARRELIPACVSRVDGAFLRGGATEISKRIHEKKK